MNSKDKFKKGYTMSKVISKETVSDLVSHIGQYDSKFVDLTALLEEAILSFPGLTISDEVPTVVPPKPTKKQIRPREKVKNDEDRCEYILKRGKRVGEQCLKPAKLEYEGKKYCGTLNAETGKYSGHMMTVRAAVKKSETLTKKPPLNRKVKSTELEDTKAKKVLRVMMDTKQTTVKKHPDFENITYHPFSNIAVDATKGQALGNVENDGTIGPLTENQKNICLTNNWPIKQLENELEPVKNMINSILRGPRETVNVEMTIDDEEGMDCDFVEEE
jgi:hypothetical protein